MVTNIWSDLPQAQPGPEVARESQIDISDGAPILSGRSNRRPPYDCPPGRRSKFTRATAWLSYCWQMSHCYLTIYRSVVVLRLIVQ
jgi:hypothetical protein